MLGVAFRSSRSLGRVALASASPVGGAQNVLPSSNQNTLRQFSSRQYRYENGSEQEEPMQSNPKLLLGGFVACAVTAAYTLSKDAYPAHDPVFPKQEIKVASSVEEDDDDPEPEADPYARILGNIGFARNRHPNNLALKYFDVDDFNSLDSKSKDNFYAIVRTGIENEDSGVGCYAMRPSDYDTYNKFFDKVIRAYHHASPSAVHTTDWDASNVGENGVLDVTKLGLSELSMRVRVGRNLKSFNLPGAMDKSERIRFEKTMVKAFNKLMSMPEYGGTVYSLSPDWDGEANPNLISDAKYQELINAHVMFKDMSADPYLTSAGISSDWPYGRGCWQSADKQCIIWFGEEDQLRIMCMKKGTKLNEVFDRLHKMLQVVESIDGIEFAHSDKYGYVTSCPTNLGTGMRASVHIKIPNLTADGTDTKAKEVCGPLQLSVRGTGGEHTPIGADGTVDISPRARLFIRERDIIAKLYEGIRLLMEEEKKAAK